MTREPFLPYQSLAATAEAIRNGRLTSEAVTSALLERIARLDGRLHAFACVRGEAALRESREKDRALAAGAEPGPLFGVPVAVKDLCAIAGTPTRAGGRFPTRFGPDDTATVVRRLEAAGAVIIGKTELTEGAWGSHHPEVVPPVNPFAPDCWTGVSSSGSGVAAAAGLAFATVGTDTAGSIRFPSAANGLVGLKPTWGRVSRAGVFPLADTLDHVGPMARSCLDAALMFDAMAGPDPADPTSLDAPAGGAADAARQGSLAGVRIGIDPDLALAPLDAATRTAFEAALARLEAGGAARVQVRLPDPRTILDDATLLAFAEAAVSHADSYPSLKSAYSPNFSRLLDAGRAAPAAAYARAAIWRREFAGALRRIFASVDMIALPVMPIATPTLAQMEAMLSAPPAAGAALTLFTLPINLAGAPSLTLPMGLGPNGAPLGFQLVGPDLSEASLLRAGAGYEALGPAPAWPDL